MTDSQRLVAEYAQNGSEAAFRELVSRYLGLVYSTALRLVDGDAHRAEDVAQMVFADLARMARTLSRDVMPGGWLHRHTCFVAAKTMRGERRRQSRERQAVEMNALQEQAGLDFSTLAPVLDEAVNKLGEPDRTAVLLRFFEQHDFRSIGGTIGCSEDSARMRVNRALEKLATQLKRQGIQSAGPALSAALSVNVVQTAPVGLGAAVSAHALVSGAVPATSAMLAAAKGAVLTTVQKAVMAGLFVAATGFLVCEARQAADTRVEIQMLHEQGTAMAGEVNQLGLENVQLASRATALQTENDRLKSQFDERELLKLRGEATQLKNARATEDRTEAAAKSWMDQVILLKEYLEQHPGKKTPEFRYLSIQRWLNAVEGRTGFDGATFFLQEEAESDFGAKLQVPLHKYAEAHQGRFPSDLSQLQPYCDSDVEALLLQLYEIKPASIIPADQIKAMNVKPEWVVVRKQCSAPNARNAFFANGFVSWSDSRGLP